jgi:hypothetical protein
VRGHTRRTRQTISLHHDAEKGYASPLTLPI